MSSDIEIKGFGLARMKQEGAPAHPDDFSYSKEIMNNPKFPAWYARQLKAYNDYHGIKDDQTPDNS